MCRWWTFFTETKINREGCTAMRPRDGGLVAFLVKKRRHRIERDRNRHNYFNYSLLPAVTEGIHWLHFIVVMLRVGCQTSSVTKVLTERSWPPTSRDPHLKALCPRRTVQHRFASIRSKSSCCVRIERRPGSESWRMTRRASCPPPVRVTRRADAICLEHRELSPPRVPKRSPLRGRRSVERATKRGYLPRRWRAPTGCDGRCASGQSSRSRCGGRVCVSLKFNRIICLRIHSRYSFL